MSHEDERANAEEYAARGIGKASPPPAIEAEKRRRRDLATIAATAEGRRTLAWLAGRERDALKEFRGNSRDAYFLGRWHMVHELREYLKKTLPRETYLEIVYPIEEGR